MSHFCEKARWALDHHGVEYEVSLIPPGLHAFRAKRLGTPGTSVPILVTGRDVIQGSSRIIDWAGSRANPGADSLDPDGSIEECNGIEKRLDDVMGVHIRRYYYSEALVEYPDDVRRVYLKDSSLFHKIFIYLSWGPVRKRMIELMDLGTEQGLESRDIIDGELSWLDDMLSDGREFLVGDRFSRADLTAASLISPLVLPPEHPVYSGLSLPPRMSREAAEWQDRPSIKYTRQIYKKYRW